MTTCTFTPCNRTATTLARGVRLPNGRRINVPACHAHRNVTDWNRNEPDALEMIPPARWEEARATCQINA